MTNIPSRSLLIITGALAVLSAAAISAENKYTVQVKGGLALSECRGYEDWPAVTVSHTQGKMRSSAIRISQINMIVANPVMIEAYRAGVPGNGKPFPDGAKTAKIHWKPKKMADAPAPTTIPGALIGLACMVKDSRRFSDTGGWGWALFDYDATSDTFAPTTSQQENDAKCGSACHTAVKARDYVFTVYPKW